PSPPDARARTLGASLRAIGRDTPLLQQLPVKEHSDLGGSCASGPAHAGGPAALRHHADGPGLAAAKVRRLDLLAET
ncbi:MAG: hypothetical protein ACPIOQ_49410, partial [Promethearchaeia archaeon]